MEEARAAEQALKEAAAKAAARSAAATTVSAPADARSSLANMIQKLYSLEVGLRKKNSENRKAGACFLAPRPIPPLGCLFSFFLFFSVLVPVRASPVPSVEGGSNVTFFFGVPVC